MTVYYPTTSSPIGSMIQHSLDSMVGYLPMYALIGFVIVVVVAKVSKL